MKLAARSSRRRIPPEYLLRRPAAASASPKRSSSSSARARAARGERWKQPPEHLEVLAAGQRRRRPRRAGRSGRSGTAPRAGDAATSNPATRGRPPSSRSSVRRIRTAVVLPAPLGPSSPQTVPSGTVEVQSVQRDRRAEALDAALGASIAKPRYAVRHNGYTVRNAMMRVKPMPEWTADGDFKISLQLLWGRNERPPAAPSRRSPCSRSSARRSSSPTRRGWTPLSMRRVAERLGTGAMSLYRYVPGKTELLELMLDAIHAEHAADARATARGAPASKRSRAQHPRADPAPPLDAAASRSAGVRRSARTSSPTSTR